MRIRSQFSLFTNTVVVLSACSLIGMVFWIYSHFLEENIAQSRQQQALQWGKICQDAFVRHDEKSLSQYALLMENQRDIEYVFFHDARGRIWAHTYRRFVGRPLRQWAQLHMDTQEISIPVLVKNKMAGRAVVGFSERFRRDTLRTTVLIALLQILIVAGSLAVANIIATGLFADRLTRKFAMIERASRQIEEGDFSVRVPVDQEDELGLLAKSFNHMAERLATLDQMKDQFISTVSHELRAPLSAVIMWADFLLNKDDNKEQLSPQHRAVLTMISDNAMRLSLYVRNILDAAKIKAGCMVYHREPVMLKDPVQRAVALYGVWAQKKGIAIDVHIPNDLPALMGDGERLEQVLANLISNSLKFVMKDGRIAVKARAVDGRVEVSISDTGGGIPPEAMEHLFKPFKQFGVAEQRLRGIKGTGLGLYIVKQSVEGMGGTVQVESHVGQGTSITLGFARARGGDNA